MFRIFLTIFVALIAGTSTAEPALKQIKIKDSDISIMVYEPSGWHAVSYSSSDEYDDFSSVESIGGIKKEDGSVKGEIFYVDLSNDTNPLQYTLEFFAKKIGARPDQSINISDTGALSIKKYRYVREDGVFIQQTFLFENKSISFLLMAKYPLDKTKGNDVFNITENSYVERSSVGKLQ